MTRFRAYALAGIALAIASVIGTVLVRLVRPVPVVGAFGFSETAMAGYLIQGLTWTSVGGLLVLRRPANAVGWLMVVVGVGYAVSQVTVALTFAFAAEGTARGDRLAQFAGWLTVLLQLVAILQVAIGFIFPSGRTQGGAWARLIRPFWAWAAVFVAISLTQPGPLQLLPSVENPFGVGPDLRNGALISPFLNVIVLGVIASLVVSMVTRYRAASHVEQQQLKWFVVSLGLTGLGLGFVSAEGMLVSRPSDTIALAVYVQLGSVVPIAIGIAILRYRLFDIDRIISRTIGWTITTGVLVVVFIAVVVGLQSLLGSFHQGDTFAVAASTLAAFALFQPVRRRIQDAVDRRFDRARHDAQRTIDGFADHLRDEVDLTTLRHALLATAGDAVRPTEAAVWLRAARES